MRVVAFAQPRSPNEITVTLAQRRGGSLQWHQWRARTPLQGLGSRDLTRGRLRGRFGTRGFIDMRFEASVAASRGRLPLCGRHRRSVGSLTGTLRLPTGSRRFGTVLRDRFHAWLGRDRFIGCSTFPLSPKIEDVPMFDPYVILRARGGVSVVNEGGSTWQVLERYDRDSTHMILAHARPRRFSFAEDLSSANATGIGPYFDGTLRYAATLSDPDPFYPVSGGRVSGDFRVRLDVPGPFTVAPARASLGVSAP
jgi:hypothetical protein